MESRERICRFCFEKCDTDFKAIEENTHEILNILLVTTNLAISDDPVMCTTCSEILQNCFVFKKTCLNIRHYRVAFSNDENNDPAVCEFCMNLLKNRSFTVLDIEEDISEKVMLEKYFPELDLSASKKPVVCEDCHGSLTNFSTFTTISSIVEERIKEYCAAEGVNTRDPIKLSNVINFTSKNVWRENDVLKIEDTISDESENKDMKIQGGICTLCLEKCEIFKAIDGNKKDIFDTLLPKIDFTIIQGPVICTNCEEVLVKFFDFKAKCLQTQNFVIPFLNNKNDVKLDLKDVYRSRNVTGTDVAEDQEVCGFCLNLVKNCSAVYLDVEKGDVMLEMVEQCLPELDLNIIKNTAICTSCHGSLKDFFHFVMNCSIVGEKIKKCCETSNINSKGQIEFSSSLQLSIRDVMTKDVAEDLAGIIKVEEQLCDDRENSNERGIGDGGDTVKLLGSIKEEEIFCGENDTKYREENLEMEDQKCLVNEEIEIKTEEHDFNRFQGDIVLSQSEISKRLYKMEKCGMLNLERDQSNQYIKHMLAKKSVSKIGMYQCGFCSYQTKHKYRLKIHILVHKDPSEVTLYECYSCSFQTKYKDCLKWHLLTHKDPSEVEIYKCDSCLYQAKRKQQLERHLLTHKDPSEVTMYKCDICSFQAKQKNYLKKHSLTHKDPSEVTVYKCDFCVFQTNYRHSLKGHLLMHKNPSEVTMYKCDTCSFQTKYKNWLKNHSLTHKDPSEVKMYKCDFCSFQTKIKVYLKRHLLNHKDGSDETIHECDFCSFQTKYKTSLKNHLLSHKDPSELTMYKCDSCSFQTKTKYHLKRHVLRHKDPSEVTIYNCDTCSYQTRDKNNLKNHSLKHKAPSEVTMYTCNTCSYQTRIKNSLKNHFLKHIDPSEVTMYKCDVCSFQTIYETSLRNHLLTHKAPSEVTMHKCDSCTFQTKTKYGLKRHVLKHKGLSEVTMYNCDTCSYQTNYKGNLKSHLLKHKDPSEVVMYKCETCPFQTKWKNTIKDHLLVHKNPSERTTYKCSLCSFHTKRRFNLKNHLLTHKDL